MSGSCRATEKHGLRFSFRRLRKHSAYLHRYPGISFCTPARMSCTSSGIYTSMHRRFRPHFSNRYLVIRFPDRVSGQTPSLKDFSTVRKGRKRRPSVQPHRVSRMPPAQISRPARKAQRLKYRHMQNNNSVPAHPQSGNPTHRPQPRETCLPLFTSDFDSPHEPHHGRKAVTDRGESTSQSIASYRMPPFGTSRNQAIYMYESSPNRCRYRYRNFSKKEKNFSTRSSAHTFRRSDRLSDTTKDA